MGTISFVKSITDLLATLLLIPFILVFSGYSAKAQYSLPGYLLAQSGSESVELYHYNSITQQWRLLGNTGRIYIKSIAIDANNEIVYAVDGGTLGTLDPLTAEFTPIGDIGSGNGENGTQTFSNIYGLAFDANREILYATNRNNTGIDELLQINPTTGKIIKNSMRNSVGSLADYKLIDIRTFYFGSNYTSNKFLDLSYDNENKLLYIMHNYFSTLHGINAFKNIDSQNPFEDFKVSPIQKLTGIDFDNDGKVYGTFSDNKVSTGDVIDGVGGGVINFFTTLKTIDASKAVGTTFFGLDFYKINYCDNHLTFNSTLLSNCPKIAKSTINSNTTINFDVQFKAGSSIALNNYFETPGNVNFEAVIEGFCN